ncbi:enolase-phosphatase E1 [Dermatophagoides farinae]|uniref:enolase-phosphatase E1 n=1 Tax=Dermatophagoides farinae TaxID=6954 RepID=UPI003F630368
MSRKPIQQVAMNRPIAVLLDIEGTISDIKFVSHILLPFTKNNVRKYFEEMFDRPECQEMIERLRETRQYYPDYPNIYPLSSGKNSVIKSVSDYSLAHIVHRNRISEIKQLQILLWIWGYENGLLRGHVYDEVTTVLHNWKHSQQIKIFVFSSAMVSAQQLLLCCTNHGNCLPLIDDFFDSSIGDKCNPQSYWNIAQAIGESPSKILFITDNNNEAKAALNANYNVCLMRRTDKGFAKTPTSTKSTLRKPTIQYNDGGIPIINSLEDIKFS